MLVLASARDLILLFVAFELMSIPLYYLAGFPQARAGGGGGGAQVLPGGHGLVRHAWSYGLSFLYGVAGTTDLARGGQGASRSARVTRIRS